MSVPPIRNDIPAKVRAQLAADWEQVQRFRAEMVVMAATNPPEEEVAAWRVHFAEVMGAIEERHERLRRRYPRLA